MNALVGGLSDANSSVRKAYAKSIGHLVKVKALQLTTSEIYLHPLCLYTQVAKDATINKMIIKLKRQYFEKDGNGVHMSNAVEPLIKTLRAST